MTTRRHVQRIIVSKVEIIMNSRINAKCAGRDSITEEVIGCTYARRTGMNDHFNAVIVIHRSKRREIATDIFDLYIFDAVIAQKDFIVKVISYLI